MNMFPVNRFDPVSTINIKPTGNTVLNAIFVNPAGIPVLYNPEDTISPIIPPNAI